MLCSELAALILQSHLSSKYGLQKNKMATSYKPMIFNCGQVSSRSIGFLQFCKLLLQKLQMCSLFFEMRVRLCLCRSSCKMCVLMCLNEPQDIINVLAVNQSHSSSIWCSVGEVSSLFISCSFVFYRTSVHSLSLCWGLDAVEEDSKFIFL